MINSTTHCPICLTKLFNDGRYRICTTIISNHVYRIEDNIISDGFKFINHIIEYGDISDPNNHIHLKIFYYEYKIITEISSIYLKNTKWGISPIKTLNIELPIAKQYNLAEFIQNLDLIS